MMDVDHPERDQNWDDAARPETERLDRNWSALLIAFHACD
jgi:hypothetical protein